MAKQQKSPLAEIPTIVLFGDRYSGKSSVLKRLTGGLPLTGIRTYSIVEIRLLKAEEPLHKISLRYIEDKNHQPISPWEITFAIITDLDEEEIEKKLHEAQRYVRNPSITKHTLLPPDIDELCFTKNSVCVTISGPDQMYNLSMIDLPGVVRNDESHEIFVLSLIKDYIKKESAILVPIFPATSDINTQCAHRLVREADPTGQRTVAVLTKMDRIVDVDYPCDDEKHLELATLVKGQGEHQLVNGTYVIRNPTNSEIHEDPDELEIETIKALKQIRIWKDVPSDRYGLHNLTIKLYERVRTCYGLSQIDNQPKLPVSYESNETSLVYLLF
ncbi:P-loop containing nucleoside triphosphate hydrolase protein [Rhizophagus diaphanus]|nr:P-loop containing nucleoside triphosphate hydrolase protein [Rhizophagus diaphanus] [Rhizophagus sp. MUCL 43196]